MRRFNRTSSLAVAIAMALGLLIQASTVPAAVVAKVPAVSVSVTPFPNNASSGVRAYVTAGDFVALDIDLSNHGPSTVVHLDIDDEITGPRPAYLGTLIMGGSLAGQTSCSTSGAFSCGLGNVPSGGDLQLRVIYLTAPQTGAVGFGIFGTSSGASSSDPGTSHGDTFTDAVTIDARSPFIDSGDLGTSGYVPPQGDDLQTSLAGFGPSNPLWTRITVPAAALSNQPFGATAFLQEANSFSGVVCPVASCFGQTSSITLAGGETLAAPFKVEVRVDNAKRYTNLKQWALIHVFDDGSSYEIVDQPCVMSHGSATNAPCVQSKSTAHDDKKDYVAVLWLTRNGYIRNG